MSVKNVKDLNLSGKRVLVRADFNVPLKEGEITDDTRIKAALPTLEYILEQEGASIVLMSHLGRPKGERKAELSLAPIGGRLAELLGVPVKTAPDCVGEETLSMAKGLEAGEVLLLENLRFYKEETDNDPGFAEKLAQNGDVYINDAFGTAHRAHASTEGVARLLPSAAGFLIDKEVRFFEHVLSNPEKPFVAIIGGAKVSTKIGVLETLLDKCTTLVIGGAMSYTFLKAQGYSVGASKIEEEYLDTAKSLLEQAEKAGVQVVLPEDHMCAEEFSEEAQPRYVDTMEIPGELIGLDIGPNTLERLHSIIGEAKTLVWNGPMGVFEFESYAKGTLEVAEMVSKCKGTTIVGGGDSVAAVNKFGFADSIDHVSTGGGASLEFLEGKKLPGIAVLEK
ncbi:MAG: phosphoglycerate kinase [Spirochaetaceae bacterium]